MFTQKQVDAAGLGDTKVEPNLYVRVTRKGFRSWLFRYRDKTAKRDVEFLIGPTADMSLRDVRTLAHDMREVVKLGLNPKTLLSPAEPRREKTFKEYAEQVIQDLEHHHKHKYVQLWTATFDKYVYPTLGKRLPRDIAIGDILDIIKPLWKTKTETGKKVRFRIWKVLDHAAILEGDPMRPNPATWAGVLNRVLDPPRTVRPSVNRPAAPYSDVPRIMSALATKTAMSALCLRWTILTACRHGEARGATWDEIDLAAKVWTIPMGRMKAKREHRVPLSDDAIEILTVAKARNETPNQPVGSSRVFPGPMGGLLSDVAVNKTLHGIAPGVTVHGFRSSFRDWGAEKTDFSSDALELALAHRIGDDTVRAYHRSDLLDRRVKIMQSWSDYCAGRSNLIALVA